MKKIDFVKAVAEKSGVSQKETEKVISAMSEVIVATCRDNGDEINLAGFGKFRQKSLKARKGINPLTGAKINIPESHSVTFTPSAGLKQIVGK